MQIVLFSLLGVKFQTVFNPSSGKTNIISLSVKWFIDFGNSMAVNLNTQKGEIFEYYFLCKNLLERTSG